MVYEQNTRGRCLVGFHRYNFFVDMDGTIADFDRLFLEETGMRFAYAEKKYGSDGAWKMLKEIPDFWLRLDKVHGADALMTYLCPYDVIILTAPSKRDTGRAMVQKKKWIGKHYGAHLPVIYRFAKDKCKLAAPNAILIDDHKQNIDQWIEAGGIGIRHNTTEETLEELALLEHTPISGGLFDYV